LKKIIQSFLRVIVKPGVVKPGVVIPGISVIRNSQNGSSQTGSSQTGNSQTGQTPRWGFQHMSATEQQSTFETGNNRRPFFKSNIRKRKSLAFSQYKGCLWFEEFPFQQLTLFELK
jgi:hypothetical protein